MTDLAQQFEALNRAYFDGELPKYEVVFSDYLENYGKGGRCRPGERRIELRSGLANAPDELRRVLLHEMCHHFSVMHDSVFAAQLERLDARGEAWAAEEARCCDHSGEDETQSHIYDEFLPELAMQDPERSFADVLDCVAREWGCLPDEWRELLPELRLRWDGAVEDARMLRAIDAGRGQPDTSLS